MHDMACEFARAIVGSKDGQKQLAQTSLNVEIASTWKKYKFQKRFEPRALHDLAKCALNTVLLENLVNKGEM